MPENITEYSAIAVIALFLIKEMFAFLKSRNANSGNHTDFKLINYKLDNHIETISKEIVSINEEMREIKRDVSEIKGKLR